jgi:hypothetical protein
MRISLLRIIQKLGDKIIMKIFKFNIQKIKKYLIITTSLIVTYIILTQSLLLILNREIGGNMSESIAESKKRNVFKFEYNIPNNVIEVPGIDTFHVESVWLEELWRSEYSYPEITHRDSVDINYKVIIKFKNSNFAKTLNESWQIKKKKDTLIDGKIQPYKFSGVYKSFYSYSYPFFNLPIDSVIIWDIKSGNPSPQPDSITGSKKIGEIKMIKQ